MAGWFQVLPSRALNRATSACAWGLVFGPPAAACFHEAVAILQSLTSFEFFDCLAGAPSRPVAVVPVVQRLARAALGLEGKTT